MDILAHGLYGGAAFFPQSKRPYFKAFLWGVFPDLIAFGWFFPILLYRVIVLHAPAPSVEPPAPDVFPAAVSLMYSFSHSLVIFGIAFALVWFYFRAPQYEMLAWPLHIVMDIPTHTAAFFPTPFLFPLSSFSVSGISWATPWLFFTYWGVLVILYAAFIIRRFRQGRTRVK